MKKTVLLFGLFTFSSVFLFSQERFRKYPPLPEPLQELQLPAIESFRLENGLTVAVAQRKGLPFVCVDLAIQAGEFASPEGLPGLATFTAEMLRRGTLLYSASDIEERIESIGGSLSTTTALDQVRFSFFFLNEYLDQALGILSQMILQPAMSEKEIVNLKRIQYYNLLEKLSDPEFVGQRQLRRLLFRDHPYLKSFYNEDVIKNFTRKDALLLYERYYRPNNAVIVLAGDFDSATISGRISRFFRVWEARNIEIPALPPPVPSPDDKVFFVNLPGAKDATILLGNVIFARSDAEFFPFSVLNQVLGGTPNSRLFMNLREKREYAYFAFSETDFFRCCGLYSVRAKVVPFACYEAVREILKEIETMTRVKISTSEIEQAKSYLIGNYPLQIEKLTDLSHWVSEIVTFSLGEAYWNKFYENFMLVDADRVYEVARKYFLPKPIVVIVGDFSLLVEHLKAFEKMDLYDTKGVFLYSLAKGEKE